MNKLEVNVSFQNCLLLSLLHEEVDHKGPVS